MFENISEYAVFIEIIKENGLFYALLLHLAGVLDIKEILYTDEQIGFGPFNFLDRLRFSNLFL